MQEEIAEDHRHHWDEVEEGGDDRQPQPSGGIDVKYIGEAGAEDSQKEKIGENRQRYL